VVILDKGRVAASGTLPELLGQRELRLRLDGVGAQAEARLAAVGRLARTGNTFTVTLPTEQDTITVPDQHTTTVPDLVADLVGLGVRVHAVEPGRITLEERLLDILRAGSAGEHR
jgi:ABC-2 type transport system ATP-binding protein